MITKRNNIVVCGQFTWGKLPITLTLKYINFPKFFSTEANYTNMSQ